MCCNNIWLKCAIIVSYDIINTLARMKCGAAEKRLSCLNLHANIVNITVIVARRINSMSFEAFGCIIMIAVHSSAHIFHRGVRG